MRVPKIKFDEFLRLYEKNRDLWYLRSDTVNYDSRLIDSVDTSVDQDFRFGIIDTIRYVFWKRKREKEKELKKYKENLKKAYASMYKDENELN